MTATEIMIALTILGWVLSSGTLLALWNKLNTAIETATEAANIPVSFKDVLVSGEHLMDILVRSSLATLAGEKIDSSADPKKIGADIVKQWVDLMTAQHSDALNLTPEQLAKLGTAIATGNAALAKTIATGTVQPPAPSVTVTTATVTP